MTEPTSSISLDPHGDGFLLTRTNESAVKSEMALSDMDVLTLAQSARMMSDLILSRMSQPGAFAGIHTPVAQASLEIDLHNHLILLGMIDQKGVEQRFGLPLEVAKPLSERLPVRVAEMEAADLTQTRQ